MNNKIIISCIFLISISSYANTDFSPYKIVSKDYETVSGSEKIIDNMPIVRFQGPLDLCYAFSSATLLQKYYCDDMKIKKCSEVSMDETISPIGITGFKEPLKSKVNEKGDYIAIDRNTFAHSFIDLGGEGAGGSHFELLDNAKFHHHFCTESFFPFDQFAGVNNFPHFYSKQKMTELKKMVDGKIEQLKNTYYKYKIETESVEACTECLSEVKNIIAVNGRNPFIQKAFGKGSFEEFLYEAFFRQCNKKVKLTTPTMGSFPAKNISVESDYLTNKNHQQKSELINQIKKVLNNNIPLQILFCAQKTNNKCTGSHVTVVSGYKKVCKNNDQCVDMLRLQNSYGVGWQKLYNDGWVVADEILNAISEVASKNEIQSGSMTWLSKGPLN